MSAEIRSLLARLGDILAAHGCDCPCDHHWTEHDEDCEEQCLGCRIEAVLADCRTEVSIADYRRRRTP